MSECFFKLDNRVILELYSDFTQSEECFVLCVKYFFLPGKNFHFKFMGFQKKINTCIIESNAT